MGKSTKLTEKLREFCKILFRLGIKGCLISNLLTKKNQTKKTTFSFNNGSTFETRRADQGLIDQRLRQQDLRLS